jgi:uncharacterized protein (UPF0335 family)
MRIVSDGNDGVVSVAIAEAAQRLEEQQDRIKRLEEENDALRADLLLWDKAGIGFTTEDKP